MVPIAKLTLLVFFVFFFVFFLFFVRGGILNSNQSEECECIMEFPLIHLNVLIQGLSGYEKFNSGQNQTLSRSRTK